MKKIIILIIFLVFSNHVLANEQQIKNLMDKHVSALNNKNIQGVSDSLHTLSPGFGQYTQFINNSFNQFTLVIEMNDFDYMGTSGNYAVAKIRVSYERDGGAAFQDNETISLYVFTKQKSNWKIWNLFQLEARAL